MATALISRKLNLTRDQLAAFLTDQQQIRQFELLFATVDTLQVITGTDFEFQADSAAASANEALAQISALRQSVELLQLAPPPQEFKRTRYGSFYDTTTQIATVINTATAITFNTTDLSNGVFIGSPTSRIVVANEGVYNFDTSFQLDKTTGGLAIFDFWFRLNGVNVTNSASRIQIQGNNAEIFSSLNYFFNLKANDYIELMFSVTDLGVELKTFAATAPHPGIPSIILTVNTIGGLT
jgi:hypothetical protein